MSAAPARLVTDLMHDQPSTSPVVVTNRHERIKRCAAEAALAPPRGDAATIERSAS